MLIYRKSNGRRETLGTIILLIVLALSPITAAYADSTPCYTPVPSHVDGIMQIERDLGGTWLFNPRPANPEYGPSEDGSISLDGGDQLFGKRYLWLGDRKVDMQLLVADGEAADRLALLWGSRGANEKRTAAIKVNGVETRLELKTDKGFSWVYVDLDGKAAADRLDIEIEDPKSGGGKPAFIAAIAVEKQEGNGFERLGLEHLPAEYQPIEVPGEWTMQGFHVPAGQEAEYKREFEVPSDWSGKVVKLRFDAVFADARVFVNGRELGSHEGGFTPFEIDVSRALDYGGTNLVALRVKSRTFSDNVAKASDYASHDLGGINRKVRIFALPSTYVRHMNVETRIDPAARTGELLLDLKFGWLNAPAGLDLDFELIDPKGKAIVLENSRTSLEAEDLAGGRRISFGLDNLQLWNAEEPNLYTLLLTVREKGGETEKIEQKVGFRTLRVDGKSLLVNGKPVKLRGVNYHDSDPLRGRSIPTETYYKDALAFKNANVNFIRTSHYPTSKELLDACDELGIYVESESPIVWMKNVSNQQVADYFVQVASEMVQFARNHPSVVMWSLGNESGWTPSFAAELEAIRALDDTRPTLLHNNLKPGNGRIPDPGLCELGNRHYPGVIGVDYASMVQEEGRPILFGEYAHVGRQNHTEKITDPGICDLYGPDIDMIWNAMHAQDGIIGGAIWAALDDVFFLDGIPHGYGYWGVIDSWRRSKPETWHVKKAYSPVRLKSKQATVSDDGKRILVAVENRFDFVNLNKLDILWRASGRSGQALASVPARSAGVIEVPCPADGIDDGKLNLKLFKSGRLIDEYNLDIGPGRLEDFSFPSATEDAPAPELVAEGDRIVVRDISEQGNVEWIIDADSGMLSGVDCNGNAIINGGPYLELTPLLKQNRKLKPDTHESFNTPVQDYGRDWSLDRIEMSESDSFVEIVVEGSYRQASARYVHRFHGGGNLETRCSFKMKRNFNARVWGLAFDLPAGLDRLEWDRDSYWTAYPDTHIGRPKGVAQAFPAVSTTQAIKESSYVPAPYKPEWPWALDPSPFGCKDFRSTKHNIYRASLSDAKGLEAEFISDGSQNFKADVHAEKVRAHLSEFSGIGQRRRSGVRYEKLERGKSYEAIARLKVGSHVKAAAAGQGNDKP